MPEVSIISIYLPVRQHLFKCYHDDDIIHYNLWDGKAIEIQLKGWSYISFTISISFVGLLHDKDHKEEDASKRIS